jgi:AraC-like DNA-binding protein
LQLKAVEPWQVRPESIRLSSRALGWGPLNIERREMDPASDFFPGGFTEHLIFVSDNYVRDLSLADIGEAARLSPFHLTRVFKKAMGMSPHQYLVQVRVNSARALLTSGAGRQSLAEVAAAVGFADQSHLARQFKRVFGLSPSRCGPKRHQVPEASAPAPVPTVARALSLPALSPLTCVTR